MTTERFPSTTLAVVIGAMKSGTTSLFRGLASHPSILATRETETHFFSAHYRKGISWYRDQWDHQWESDQSIWLEASPSYTQDTMSHVAAERLHKFRQRNNVAIRLIYIMRDPIGRIESDYRHVLNIRMNVSPTRIRSINCGPLEDKIVNTSRYNIHLRHFRKFFSRDEMCLLQTDHLSRNAQDAFSTICKFLSIESSFDIATASNRFGNEATTNTAFYQFARRSQLLLKAGRFFPQRTKYTLLRGLAFLSKPRVDPELWRLTADRRAALHRILAPDMRELSRDYGVDVSLWGF